MSLEEEYRQEMQEKVKNVGIDKLLAVPQRCPKCMEPGMIFDKNTGKIRCTKCGFEVSLNMTK